MKYVCPHGIAKLHVCRMPWHNQIIVRTCVTFQLTTIKIPLTPEANNSIILNPIGLSYELFMIRANSKPLT